MAGWFRRWFGWLWGGRSSKPRGLAIAAPHTLVAKVQDASASDRDRHILKVAEESLRRGFPEQAEIAYERAAELYREQGNHRKSIAVLRALARLRPSDPMVHMNLAEAFEGLDRRMDAALSLVAAAERFREYDQPQQAAELERRARVLQAQHESSSHSLPQVASEGLESEPPGPSPSTDLSDEEVKSLVMEALHMEPAAPASRSFMNGPTAHDDDDDDGGGMIMPGDPVFADAAPGLEDSFDPEAEPSAAIELPDLQDPSERVQLPDLLAPSALPPLSASKDTLESDSLSAEDLDDPHEADTPAPELEDLKPDELMSAIDDTNDSPRTLFDPGNPLRVEDVQAAKDADLHETTERPVPRISPTMSIPDASTVYDPRGSAAMQPAEDSEPDQATKVAQDDDVKALLARLRRKDG